METPDAHFMRFAIEASWRARDEGNLPFGAALVRDGQVVQVSRNNQTSTQDCTGHAEVVLIREASAAHDPEILRGATVYASGEPCAMCSGAMFWAGVRRVVYGATQGDIIAVLGGKTLPIACADVLRGASPPVLVDGPVLRAEALAVLRGAVERAAGAEGIA